MIAAKVAAKKKKTETVADKFIESYYDENGVFNGIKLKMQIHLTLPLIALMLSLKRIRISLQ